MGEGISLLYRRCSNKTGRCWLYTGNLALTSEQVHTLDHVWMRMVNGYFKPYKRHTHSRVQWVHSVVHLMSRWYTYVPCDHSFSPINTAS